MRRIATNLNAFSVLFIHFVAGVLCCFVAILLAFAAYVWLPVPVIGNASPFRVAFAFLLCAYTIGIIWAHCKLFLKERSLDIPQRVAIIASVCSGSIILASDYAATALLDNMPLTLALSSAIGAVVAGVQWMLLRKSINYAIVLMFAVVWFFLCWGYAIYVFLQETVRALS